jgi:hypothetical protein
VRRSPRRLPRLGRRRLAGGAVAAVVMALALAALSAGAANAAQGSEFCKRRLAVDYAAPLANMPGAHPVPEGELPFGPRNFSIYPIGHIFDRPHLALTGGSYGYEFFGKNNPYRVLDLGWRFKATAYAVDRDGRVRGKLGTRGWRVTKVQELSELKVGFPARRPGFVRVDVRISTLSGRTLGAYRDYFRVLKPTDDVRLAVDDPSVHPGERVVGLVENRGAGDVSVATSTFEVEHFSAGVWTALPQPVTPQSIKDFGWWLSSGENGRCYGYTVPTDAPPGRYRFTTSVSLKHLNREEPLSGYFEVTS